MKKKSEKKKRILRLIAIPVAFCLLLYLAVFAVGYPMFSDILSIGSVFLSDKQVDYSKEYENIFVPTGDSKDTVDASEVEFPGINKQFGDLKIKGRNVDAKLFFGDGDIALRNGVGVYAGSFVPGYGKTILVAGHNNTYFNGLKNVKKGDVVTIRTSWGNYKYKINKTAILKDTDKKAFDLSADEENLVLYTCYPFDTLGLTEKRFFVYADKISGPEIVGLYE